MLSAPDDLVKLAVALGIGMLIGADRERTKGTGAGRGAAGVRTFMLLALVGALADRVGDVGILVAGAFVCLLVLASYRRSQATDPGLTTEVAMLVTFFLGILTMRATPVAAALAVLVAVVLASKSRLHHLIREALTEQDAHDLLLLLAAAFVVMPLLPDRAIDPWSAINPRKIWALVVAVMAVSTAGYVALRAFESRLGLALAGLAGGFVSSLATISAMAMRARNLPEQSAAFASAGLASNFGTIVQLGVVIGMLSPGLLKQAAWPLAASGTVALIAAAIASLRAMPPPDGQGALAGKRPFEPRHVLGFVLVLTAIMLLAAIARHWLGEASLPWVLAASGLVDVHSSAASAAQLAASGHVQPHTAMLAIFAALASNSLAKCVASAFNGGKRYALEVVPGIVLMVAAFAAAMAIT